MNTEIDEKTLKYALIGVGIFALVILMSWYASATQGGGNTIGDTLYVIVWLSLIYAGWRGFLWWIKRGYPPNT